MYNEIKELLFPYGIGQLICLIFVIFGFFLLVRTVRSIRVTIAAKKKRDEKCREAIRNGYEYSTETGYSGYEDNYRIHEIR